MSEELKQRALKITEALYRTTDFFSDAEPLKWSLRENALEIMNSVPEDVVCLEKLTKSMFLKLELASSGTFIAKVNFETLKRAYAEFLRESVALSDSYKNLFGNILSDPSTLNLPAGKAGLRRANAPVSDNEEVSVKRVNSNRQGALVSALKQKGPLSVGDLAKMLDAPISEKTVQREMAGLVASGTIKQEGEKRWRRYFIGSPDAKVGAPTPS